MASIMAIVSKAVFEKEHRGAKVGDVLAIDRYSSSPRAFEQLGKNDALFLVTVRPPEQLWLVAIVDAPKKKGDAWIGAKNKAPIADISASVKKLVLASGDGVTARKGALAMSLQTPRVLAEADVTLLRSLAGAPAVTAYRDAVEETPAAKKARAQAAAAGTSSLRFERYRKPFADLSKLTPTELELLADITTSNRAGDPDELVDHEDWAPMELVDVVDVARGEVRYLLFVWPYGSARLFDAKTSSPIGYVVQHGLELDEEHDSPDLRRALAGAYASASPKISELIDFDIDKKPVVKTKAQVDAKQLRKDALEAVEKALGRSDERFRVFEDLSAAQQKLIRDAFAPIPDDMPWNKLQLHGLPPIASLRRWAGIDPPTILERRAGTWPVWKWLKAAVRQEIDRGEAIAALAKELGVNGVVELAVTLDKLRDEGAYDLFDTILKSLRGDVEANAHAARVVRFVGDVIDAAGEGAAVEVAKRAVEADSYGALAAYATFALVARARRRGEPFPREFYEMSTHINSPGPGVYVREAARDVLELIPMADRDEWIVELAPYFVASFDHPVKNGKELDVPVAIQGWLYADLCPSERALKGMAADLARWHENSDPKPLDQAVAMLAKIGADKVLPYLKAEQTPKTKWLAKAIAALEGGASAPPPRRAPPASPLPKRPPAKASSARAPGRAGAAKPRAR